MLIADMPFLIDRADYFYRNYIAYREAVEEILANPGIENARLRFELLKGESDAMLRCYHEKQDQIRKLRELRTIH